MVFLFRVILFRVITRLVYHLYHRPVLVRLSPINQAAPLPPACEHIPVRVERRAHPVSRASRVFTLVPEGSFWGEHLTLDQGTILKGSFPSASVVVHNLALSMGRVLDIHLTGVFAIVSQWVCKIYGQVCDELKKKAIIGKRQLLEKIRNSGVGFFLKKIFLI